MDNSKKLSFGQRFGGQPTELPMQIDILNPKTRIALWNFFYRMFGTPYLEEEYSDDQYYYFHLYIWTAFLEKQIDDFPEKNDYLIEIRVFIENRDWFKIYELFEFIAKCKIITSPENYERKDFFYKNINEILTIYSSAYRLIDKNFTPISNEHEIDEIKQLKDKTISYRLENILSHLNKSIELISKKPTPDYRNSINESISMVEGISLLIEPTAKSLGEALSKIEKTGSIEFHKALKKGFSEIYGYTSDADGIRHALGFGEKDTLDIEDARFFLVSCSAFTNYLIEKAVKAGVLK